MRFALIFIFAVSCSYVICSPLKELEQAINGCNVELVEKLLQENSLTCSVQKGFLDLAEHRIKKVHFSYLVFKNREDPANSHSVTKRQDYPLWRFIIGSAALVSGICLPAVFAEYIQETGFFAALALIAGGTGFVFWGLARLRKIEKQVLQKKLKKYNDLLKIKQMIFQAQIIETEDSRKI